MKVDLNELERVALAARGRPVCGPDTTLALVARIRELESASTTLVTILQKDLGDDYLISDPRYCEARAILEKGVELL